MSPMRRLAIFTVLLLFLLPGRPAQGQYELAVTGGVNLSTLDPWTPWTWHGRALGIAVGFPVSDKWSIQLAGQRSVKGQWVEYDTAGCPDCGGGLVVTYIEFMVLSDIRIALGDRVRLHLLAGPFGGHQGDRYWWRTFDFGVTGGAQVEVGLYGNWGLQAGTLYTHGLVNTSGQSQKTRTLTLRGGVSYSIR